MLLGIGGEYLFEWCHQNRKSVCMALFLNKLYLYSDVSPLNKIFTTFHHSTQFCVLGSISVCKGRYLFGIINISKNFFLAFSIFANVTLSFRETKRRVLSIEI